jgi:hypothetical protein
MDISVREVSGVPRGSPSSSGEQARGIAMLLRYLLFARMK